MTAPKLIKRPAAAITTIEPAPQPQTFSERFARVGSAFVSIAKTIHTPAHVEAIAKRFPDWKLRYYAEFIKINEEWRTNLERYLNLCDALIVVCDESRLITRSVLRELATAKKLGKLLVIFNAVTTRWERFNGYEFVAGQEGKRVARLKERDQAGTTFSYLKNAEKCRKVLSAA